MINANHTTIFIFALLGLLTGLIVAEIFYKKSVRHANYVMPAAIIRNSHHIVQQKFFYYFFFLTIVFVEYVLHVKVPEPVFWLDGFAIAGGDVQKLATKFFRLK